MASSQPTTAAFDAAIVGAGPAGCSCALWLAEYGLRCVLVDRRAAPCASLDGYRFAQDWVLGAPGRSLADIGAAHRAHLDARGDIARCFGATPRVAERDLAGRWRLTLDDGTELCADAVVLATGVVPVRPPAYFGSGAAPAERLHDAVSLTHARPGIAGERVLLLGGGDNAAENAVALAAAGNRVTLCARGGLRAQRRFTARIAALPAITLLDRAPLPAVKPLADGGFEAHWPRRAERFDRVAVLFGSRPDSAALDLLRAADPRHADADGGVFVAGDAGGRLHPCVASAVGDGAHVASQVERWLHGRRAG